MATVPCGLEEEPAWSRGIVVVIEDTRFDIYCHKRPNVRVTAKTVLGSAGITKTRPTFEPSASSYLVTVPHAYFYAYDDHLELEVLRNCLCLFSGTVDLKIRLLVSWRGAVGGIVGPLPLESRVRRCLIKSRLFCGSCPQIACQGRIGTQMYSCGSCGVARRCTVPPSYARKSGDLTGLGLHKRDVTVLACTSGSSDAHSYVRFAAPHKSYISIPY